MDDDPDWSLYVYAPGDFEIMRPENARSTPAIMSAPLTVVLTSSPLALARALVESAITVEPIAVDPSTGRFDPRYVHRAGGWTLSVGDSRYEFTANLSEARTRAVLLDVLFANRPA